MKLDPIARTGHLTDLGIEGLALGELSLPARRSAEQHLRDCETCRARVEEVGAEIPPLVTRPWRRLPWLGAATLAAAVVAWIGVARSPQPSDFVRKGSTDLEIWIHDGTEPALLIGEGPVSSGERLGFRLSTPDPAHAMIVATDDQGDWGIVFPRDGATSASIDAREEQLLPVAVRLDDSDGDEQFHAVLCAGPFDVDDALAFIEGEADEDCLVRSRRIRRPTP